MKFLALHLSMLHPFAFSHREKTGSSNPPCAYFFIQFPSMVLISWPQRLTQLWTCWTCQLYLQKHPSLALLNAGCASQLALTWHQPNTNLGDLGKLPLSTLKRSGWGKVCVFSVPMYTAMCVWLELKMKVVEIGIPDRQELLLPLPAQAEESVPLYCFVAGSPVDQFGLKLSK